MLYFKEAEIHVYGVLILQYIQKLSGTLGKAFLLLFTWGTDISLMIRYLSAVSHKVQVVHMRFEWSHYWKHYESEYLK